MVEVNPAATVQQIAGGYWLPRCLHVVADLGVADALDDTPRSAAELAASVGADAGALGRVLRLLSAHGIFESRGNGYGHSPASRFLRTDHPQSMRAFARMLGLPVNWAACGALAHSVRTGLPAAAEILPDGYWAYFAEHPEENAVFNAAMVGKAQSLVPEIVAAYDFSGFARIGDIGGGHGHLLRAVLDAAPLATGVLFDLPHVIEALAEGASPRLVLQPGDFFKDALPLCGCYVMMEVIHDWSDAESVAILEAVRRVAPANAKLLLIEQLIPAAPGPDWAITLDVLMLYLLGGRQRTLPEYAALLNNAGFLLQRAIGVAGGFSILEAIPT